MNVATELAGMRLARHALTTRFEDLSADAVLRAKTFILDTFGVGVAGSTAAGAAEFFKAAASWGTGNETAVWGRRERAPAPTAALLNAFQSHCQEFDCVHERAVLHPMATLLPAVMAFAEREGGVSGRDLIAAVAVGVDVAITLGLAAKLGIRFFRPATSGGFGAAAALGRLAGLDTQRLAGTFGLQYAQTSGTMQPHVEGSVALPLQVGFNSRAAVQACDMARAGLEGPRDVFEGPFGYLRLFEGEWDLATPIAELGKTWRIAEVSHKPFPSGRATHGGVEGIMALREAHGFGPDDVVSVVVTGPPLMHRLCGRPIIASPTANYARLCMAFVGAKVLQHGDIDLAHYRDGGLTDPRTHELATRISMRADGSTDPNALMPQTIEIALKDGRELSHRIETMLAHPTKRLTREQHLRKFRRCWEFAEARLPASAGAEVIEMVDRLEDVTDIRSIARLLAAQ